MSEQIPLVDYLVLGDTPHLVATTVHRLRGDVLRPPQRLRRVLRHRLQAGRRGDRGHVNTFTIVAMAAPGIPVPFVSAVIDCDGIPVRGNIINVEPDPDHVSTDMKVRLATFSLGEDDHGKEAIGFGFEPASN